MHAENAAQIERGRYLSLAGDCASCHTARGGQAYAGGRVVPTPFGSIPAPNLTPDMATGIGGWSADDFYRALHEGRGKDGQYLYPAFPYTSYTRVTRPDSDAIFAYLRSLPPVHSERRDNDLRFPYSMRRMMAGWRLFYFTQEEYVADSSQSAAWNRGAYLVNGLGHCNDCHSTRNSLGATVDDPSLAGGMIPMQNWYAPDLSTKANGGLEGWTTKDIVDLLKTGRSARGTAFGPMAEVVRESTQHLNDDDLAAMALYLQSLPARPVPKKDDSPLLGASFVVKGQAVYKDRCASCHGDDGKGRGDAYPPLAGNTSVVEPIGANAIRVVLSGGFAPATHGNPRPYSMPPFSQQLSDEDVAAVVSYIRQAWTNTAPAVTPDDVRTYRSTPGT
ncbi:mono/diheme cytochrome c family protein [Luteibacter sp. Sphag1AF]|uniref:c-type cytochrome n=1 Tax=Luteibacter sp. Sphag1AF TaxID=2587031 RepID=UPI00185E63F5|nr:mono/diheme cytochrome c family protein [Luteibacter sp. Sphag1AF]